MGLYGRFYSDRDRKLLNSLNAEIMGDIIQTVVTIFKLVPQEINVNVYGEADNKTGKVYYPGIQMTCFIKRETMETPSDEFGTTRVQIVKFSFREAMLKQVNLYPENGDLISFNADYHQIDNVQQQQFLGGVDDKSWSIVCDTHYTRLSGISLFERQG
jgi:hypothetical protein